MVVVKKNGSNEKAVPFVNQHFSPGKDRGFVEVASHCLVLAIGEMVKVELRNYKKCTIKIILYC
jgi:hypothetical protein